MDIKELKHPIRKEIFRKLMYKKNLSFSQLMDKKVRSNHFNYHLSELIKAGIIKKENFLYSLTKKGDKIAVYFDTESSDIYMPPFTSVAVALRKDNEILLSRLEKGPFKNCWAISAVGRLKEGEGLKESAYRQTIERTGYTPKDLELKIIYSIKTYYRRKILSQHLHFIFNCKNFTGKLKETTKDRTNKWVKIKDLRRYNIFLENITTLKHIDNGGITYLEIVRRHDGKKFTSSKVIL
ncbi:MAG: NUDIX domain-containing protein [Candidatus Nanoarchaeia archaeon]|nr:NUDIX domain-containing protein [Candidatus Nanoarchaeia archaeon]